MSFSHQPVLYEEVLALLRPKKGGVYFDGTLGGAGHASGVAERIGETGTIIGCDVDPIALAAAKERLSAYPTRVLYFRENFKQYASILRESGITALNGALLDLGVSSPQLDEESRGFSYHNSAPLDMRMSGEGPSAAELVNGYPEERLRELLYRYGEEKNAPAIAREIVRFRETKPIETTTELVEIIKRAFGGRFTDKHPAKRTFQALRIEVNDELAGLEEALRGLVSYLVPSGVLAVITFHSLEDRIVKRTFASFADGCTCPKEFPICTCGFVPTATVLTRHPLTAGEQELEENSRAHSAKLRAVQKL